MNTEIYKVVIRDGKYMGEMEAILLLKRKWWKFTWWERKNFARGIKIMDRQYIKSFPFTPKTFIIDVTEECVPFR